MRPVLLLLTVLAIDARHNGCHGFTYVARGVATIQATEAGGSVKIMRHGCGHTCTEQFNSALQLLSYSKKSIRLLEVLISLILPDTYHYRLAASKHLLQLRVQSHCGGSRLSLLGISDKR